MGRPKDASGCLCVLSLCHLVYSHLPNISPWRLRGFTEFQSRLIATYPVTALCTWCIEKSSNNLLCIRPSLHSTPCRPHRPCPRPLASDVCSIHGGARGEELLHGGGVAVDSRPVQRCVASGAEGLGNVNRWRATPRGSPPPTPTAAGETAICGARSVSFMDPSTIENPEKNGEFFSLRRTYLNISHEFSGPLSHPYSGPYTPMQVANVQESFSLKMSYDNLLCFTSTFFPQTVWPP